MAEQKEILAAVEEACRAFLAAKPSDRWNAVQVVRKVANRTYAKGAGDLSQPAPKAKAAPAPKAPAATKATAQR